MNQLITDAIDHLTLASYTANRNRFPQIAPEKWIAIFPEQKKLEESYKQSLTTIQQSVLSNTMNKSQPEYRFEEEEQAARPVDFSEG